MTPKAAVPVLEAVGDQLSFGEVIEPGQLPAAVSAAVKRREALVTSHQLDQENKNIQTDRTHLECRFQRQKDILEKRCSFVAQQAVLHL